ncbi:MAG: hypothetical protein JSS20_08205 [Proteobacteria bacterium]|nr:hypothetical protein [Pseudomonadota bacterium]
MRWLLMTLLMAWTASAAAHSWYPHWCCSDNDCAPVLRTKPVEGGKWVTSRHGTVFVPRDYRIDRSQDNDAHVCMMPDPVIPGKMKLLCYFEPGTS